jgi:hypothetical protein
VQRGVAHRVARAAAGCSGGLSPSGHDELRGEVRDGGIVDDGIGDNCRGGLAE